MKRVLIDLEKIRYPLNGIGQYCTRFGEALENYPLPPDLETHLFVPPDKTKMFGKAQNYYPARKHLRLFPFLQRKFDLWHSTHQSPRHLPFAKKTKYVLSIMDLNFITEVKDQNFVKNELARIQTLVDRADYITVISQYVADDIYKHLKVSCPLEVVYLAHSLNMHLAPKPMPIKSPFLFSIGVVDPKKNFHTLVPMLQELKDYHLVIAGPNNTLYASEIRELAEKLELANRVHLVGAIDDAEKLWLYQNCEAFVFPSLLEGFGIPPLEAMSLGKPTFISDKCSLPEVTGGLAYQWNNFEPSSMMEVFSSGMRDFKSFSDKKNDLISHANKFTWELTTKKYLDIYRKVLS